MSLQELSSTAVTRRVKCFYDQQEAVGICKNCGRGVCQDSSVTVGKSLACKGRCEGEITLVNDLMARSRKAYPRAAGIYARYAAVPAVLGVLSLGYAVFDQETLGSMTGFYFGLGVAMLLAAGLSLYNARRIKKP